MTLRRSSFAQFIEILSISTASMIRVGKYSKAKVSVPAIRIVQLYCDGHRVTELAAASKGIGKSCLGLLLISEFNKAGKVILYEYGNQSKNESA